jgi:hypothetical protein
MSPASDSLLSMPAPRVSEDGSSLRVGVIVGSPVIPVWTARILEDIRASRFAQLALVLCARRFSKGLRDSHASLSTSLLLFRAYEFLDYWLNRASGAAAQSIDVSREFPEATVVCTDPTPADMRSYLLDAKLDVLINLDSDTLSSMFLHCASHGVWSLDYGGPGACHRDGPEFSWEVLHRRPTSVVELRQHPRGEGHARAVGRALFRTNLISVDRTQTEARWRARGLVMRCLRDLHRNGCLDTPAPSEEPRLDTTPLPGCGGMVRLLGGLSATVLGRVMRRAFYTNQWFLALKRRGSEPSAKDAGLRLLIPPAGHSYADPFLIKKDGASYLFFEQYQEDRPKGVIACLPLNGDGKIAQPRTVLETDYHLSYPFVFEWEGDFYLIPETGARRTVELYRAVEFPYRWSLERILLEDVCELDATIYERGGKFWMFSSPRRENCSDCDELHVHFANSLRGPWKPHPRNPVVWDIRRARPAGRLFTRGGQLFRPGQDGSVRYGHAVVFNRVDVLDTEDYQETPVGRLDPSWLSGNVATHTFNANEDWEVVDAQRYLAKFRIGGWLPRTAVLYGPGITLPKDCQPWAVSLGDDRHCDDRPNYGQEGN